MQEQAAVLYVDLRKQVTIYVCDIYFLVIYFLTLISTLSYKYITI